MLQFKLYVIAIEHRATTHKYRLTDSHTHKKTHKHTHTIKSLCISYADENYQPNLDVRCLMFQRETTTKRTKTKEKIMEIVYFT